MDEPIEMLFGLWAQVGPRDHVLGRGPDPSRERENFGGFVSPIENAL